MEMTVLDQQVTKILLALGFSPKNIGFHYIRQALILTAQDASLLELITKNLYAKIAAQFNTKVADVERTMRFAIGEWYQDKCPGAQIQAAEAGVLVVPERCPSNLTVLRVLTNLLTAHTSLS